MCTNSNHAQVSAKDSLRQKVKETLRFFGLSHVFSETDFDFFISQTQNPFDIAQMFQEENKHQSDYNAYIF